MNNNTNKEVWKDIRDYEGWYQISNHGRVRSVDRSVTNSLGRVTFYKGQIKKPQDNGNGYKYVQLKQNKKYKNFYIHRLVAEYFIGKPKENYEVNHIDENKENNHYSNLEWVTSSENTLHGTNLSRSAEKNGIPIVQLDTNNKIIRHYESIDSAEKELGLSNIRVSLNSNYRKAGGFRWVRLEDYDPNVDYNQERKRNSNIKVIKVDVVSGEKIEYRSIREASKENNIDRKALRRYLGSGLEKNGIKWIIS